MVHRSPGTIKAMPKLYTQNGLLAAPPAVSDGYVNNDGGVIRSHAELAPRSHFSSLVSLCYAISTIEGRGYTSCSIIL